MCSEWNEEDHRLGTGCKRSSPVGIRYKSVFDVENPNSREQCRQNLQVGFQKLNATEGMQDTMLDMVNYQKYSKHGHLLMHSSYKKTNEIKR